MTVTDLGKLIEERLGEPAPCFGHCKEQSELKFLHENDKLVACNACPSGYVSRIITYGYNIDLQNFKAYISRVLGSSADVRDEDIRVATRYRWDVGIESDYERIMKEAYWAQNYRRTKSNDPNRVALFHCSNRDSLFLQPITSAISLCDICRVQSRS